MTNHFASYWKIPFVLLFAFAIKATSLYGQIEVEPAITAPFTPTSLIENVFLGSGIQITDIQFYGKPEAVGYFSNGMEDIGFEEGLLLTTGESWQADRANNSAIAGSPNSSFAVSAELERLTGEKLEDVLEYVIKFRPSTDSVAFRYRFASEEYPEFGCDCFNDVFAFYIYGSGLDPNGENMAVLPNTNLPVSVKTIHPFDPDPNNGAGCLIELPECMPTNEDLYIDNTGSTTLEYDGFTKTLIARAKVIPCEEYTLKIAIADVKDDIVDSSVFLEAESFNSNEVNIETAGVGLDGSITEGCSAADLVFSIPVARNEDYTVNFTKIGNAIPNQDFIDFPNSITIPAGELSTVLAIETISDQLTEGLDSIGIAIEIAPCFPPREIWIPIKDDQLSLPELGENINICLGDTVQLMGQTDIQSSTMRSFEVTPLNEIAEVQDNSSNPGNLDPSIFPNVVSGITPATLTKGLIHSICVNISHPRAGDLDIFLQAPSGRFIELSTDNGRLGNDYLQTCFTENATTSILDGEAPFTGDFLPEGNWERLYGEPINGTWNLIVRDDEGAGSGNVKGTMLNWSINFNPDYQVTYAWEVADNMSCQDCLDPQVFPSETTEYTLTAVDNYGCTANEKITINVQQPLAEPVLFCTNVTLNSVTIGWDAIAGALDYEVNINETGWEATNRGDLQHQVTGLQEGESIAVQVRANSSGACATSMQLISCETVVCPLPSFQVDSTNNVSCSGLNNGRIHLSAIADAFFVLGTDTSELGETAIFDQLPANTYKITVVDASKLCSDTITATIDQPVNLDLQITESRALTCFGANDGAISSLATGGTAPYDYQWTSLTTPSLELPKENNLSNLPPGEYGILVTDANNCTDQKFLPIPEPQALIVDSSSLDATCFGKEDGRATVRVNPNFNNLNFLWSNGARTATIDNLGTGNYTVSVTNEAGCEEVRQLTVDATSEITLAKEVIIPASCGGATNGTATVTATGGVGNLTYQWNDPLNQTTSTANGLAANEYEVIATDETGCSQLLTLIVPDTNVISFDTLVQAISCFGEADGVFRLDIEGDTQNFEFQWEDSPQISNGNRTDLVAGDYQLTVRQGSNCLAALNFTIQDKAPINLRVDPIPTNCNAADGSITVDIIEGNSIYTYAWADDPNRTTARAENLDKGNYTVTVFDAAGCSTTENIKIELRDSIALVAASSPVLCADALIGTASVIATGGSGDYVYQWDDPMAQATPIAQNLAAGDYSVVVRDNNGCEQETRISVPDLTIPVAISLDKKDISCFDGTDGLITTTINSPSDNLSYQWSSGETTASLSNILADSYQLTVTDENGCTHQETIIITEPTALIAETTTTPISCFGEMDGAITLGISGGTAEYVYNWKDNAQINTPNRTNLTAGDYQLTVSDANSCTAILDFKVADKTPINLITDQTPVSCNLADGVIVVGVVDGNSAYTFSWADDPNRTTAIANNLVKGDYTVTVFDADGCSTTSTIILEEKEGISLVASTTPVLCADELTGTAAVVATGGNGNYRYQWNDPTAQTNPTAQNLAAGDYEVLVLDDNGCEQTMTISVPDQTIPIDINFEKKDISCFGANDGQITTLVNSPSTNLIYQWANGETATSLTNIAPNTYQLTITDDNGCTHQEAITITEPEELFAETILDPITCPGRGDGVLTILPMGGTPPYLFSEDGRRFSTTNEFFNLTPGNYEPAIRDANNCAVPIAPIQVEEALPLSISIDNLELKADIPQPITPIITNGNGELTYTWSAFNLDDLSCTDCPSPTITPTNSQLYQLSVVDENGCKADARIRVLVEKNRQIYVPTGFTPNGDGSNDRLTVHGIEGTEILSFKIFDRWGELVFVSDAFEANDLAAGWDGYFKGKPMSTNVFAWIVEARFSDGTLKLEKGHSTLIR